jgi:uncharacterized RDD family membrane protein YckC
MGWIYMDGENEVGPLGKAEMQEAVRSGAITGNTLIRDEKSNQWKTYNQMREEASLRSAGGRPASGANPAEERQHMGAPAASGVICSECGRTFSEDDIINYKGYNICATCKPVFLQKLKEGASLPYAVVYGGFWIRFAAKIIDYFILGIANFFIQMILAAALGAAGASSATGSAANGGPPELNPMFWGGFILAMLLQLAVPITYTTWFVGKYAATPGKMACGLKIVTAEGEKVTYLRAFARYFAEIVSWMILGIGYIMAAFDDEKRTLHDHMCSTRVIRK